MRFMMLGIPKGIESAGPYWMPGARIVETMEMCSDSLRKARMLLSLDGLHPPVGGSRITFKNGKATVKRGPFPRAKKWIGGFWMIRAKSLDEATDWAARAPMAGGGSIEVRQVQETEELTAEVRKVLAAASEPASPPNEARPRNVTRGRQAEHAQPGRTP
jgi:hypothetical protein